MSQFKNIIVSVPVELFEADLTEAEVQILIHNWLATWLPHGEIKAAKTGADPVPGSGPGEGEDTACLPGQTRLHERLTGLETELAQARHELQQTTRRLREADKVKSEFIATVSHELRTPLNSIIGFAKLLLNQKLGPLNDIQQTDLSVIYNSAQHLLGLVNDVLDLSKIEAGKIRLDLNWVTVEEIVVGVMASTYILIEGKPIELREEIEPHLPQVYVDRGRIRQVVLNIISNAAKFTDAGSITLRIRPITRNDRDFICFSVKDTGIGIAPEDMDKVFEAFRQIDSSVARRAEGTGLGMPISRRLVELHGGELWVESKVGQGSTFSFTIPVQPPPSLLGLAGTE